MKKFGIILLLIICALFFYNSFFSIKTKTIYAMDTVINIKLKGTQKDMDAVCHIIENYDGKLSAYNENSEIYKLNKNKRATVSDDTAEIIQKGLKYCQMTNGAFDITLKPISDLWDVTGKKNIPTDSEILEQLKKTGYEYIKIKNNDITLDNSVEIDLGGIAKGYVTDKIIKELTKRNVSYSVIDLGGNVFVYGKNKTMKVGIQTPFKQRGDILCAINVNGKSVISSGIYERYFEENGKIYHHIYDGNTGKCTDNSIVGVTVVGDDSTMCDALSTAIMVMGKDMAFQLYSKNKNFDYMIIEKDKLYATKGIYDSISDVDDKYKLEMIK